MTLYEINEDFKAWAELVDEVAEACESDGRAPTNEEILVLQQFKNENEQNLNQKYENVVRYIKNLQSDADEVDAEIKRLQKKKKAKESVAENLKRYLENDMKYRKIDKKEVGVFKLRIQKNPPSLSVVGIIPPEWLIPQDPKLDTVGVKKAIKDGASFDWCELVSSESIRIS